MDVDVETDAFADSHISKVHLFAHKLLQTVEVGAGIEFKFGNYTFGTEGSYDFTTGEIFDKLYAEYKSDGMSFYSIAMMFMNDDDPYSFNIGSVVGISSDSIIDIATVGAEFRWDLYAYESTRLSNYRDFTVYCKVEF